MKTVSQGSLYGTGSKMMNLSHFYFFVIAFSFLNDLELNIDTLFKSFKALLVQVPDFNKNPNYQQFYVLHQYYKLDPL